MSTIRYAIKVPFPDDDVWCFLLKDKPGLLDWGTDELIITFATEEQAEAYARKQGWHRSCLIVPINSGHWT